MLSIPMLQWTNFVKFFMLLALCTIVNHIQADETSPDQQQMEHIDDTLQHGLQKRTWKNLQGSWGKRNPDEAQNERTENDSDYYGSPNHDEKPLDYNTSNDLDKLNKYLLQSLLNQRLAQMDTQYEGSNEGYPVDKRAWNKINGGWGKRVNSGQWNKFRGAWGKREPGWNNLKGLWGKRAEKWNKLSSSWGKRDSGNSNSY